MYLYLCLCAQCTGNISSLAHIIHAQIYVVYSQIEHILLLSSHTNMQLLDDFAYKKANQRALYAARKSVNDLQARLLLFQNLWWIEYMIRTYIQIIFSFFWWKRMYSRQRNVNSNWKGKQKTNRAIVFINGRKCMRELVQYFDSRVVYSSFV